MAPKQLGALVVRSSAWTETCTIQDDRFRLQKKSYDNQYAQLYYCRLLRMQPALTKQIQKEWPGTRGKSSHLLLHIATLQLALPTFQLTLHVSDVCHHFLQYARSWICPRTRKLLWLGPSTKR